MYVSAGVSVLADKIAQKQTRRIRYLLIILYTRLCTIARQNYWFCTKKRKSCSVFICLSTGFTPRRQSNFRTYGQQIARHIFFGEQHSISLATINSFAGVPTAGHTSDDLAACHLLFNVLYAAAAAFRRPISPKIKQGMPISKLFTASCTHSIAIYKVLCYNNQALGA